MVTSKNVENQLHDALEQVRSGLQDLGGLVTEKRMFGGTTFLLNGNMLCCVSKNGLMVRVGAEAEADALDLPFAQPCLGTGRRMAGFVSVAFDGLSTQSETSVWLAMARAYVEPMPAKRAESQGSSKNASRTKDRMAGERKISREAT